MTVGLDFFLFQRNEEKKQKRKEKKMKDIDCQMGSLLLR